MSTQSFTPKTTYVQGYKMAVETGKRAEAASGNNLAWFQGGRWVDLVLTEIPSLYDRQALIFPSGQAGKRAMNQLAPVPGRKWSDGDLNTVVTSEFLGLMWYAALGGASHNTVPSTASALLAASPIQSDGQTRTLTTQPTDSGALLQIKLTGTTGSGNLTVAGVTSEGLAASEVISFDASGTLYTRNSFSSVTGITINSVQTLGGSIGVNGIKYFEHTFFPATSNPTFSIEKHGDPAAGATSKSQIYLGMVMQTLGMSFPAATRDGVIEVSTTWEGNPTATCVASVLNEASTIRIWPAWATQLTRDGATYTAVTDFSVDIGAGNRNYRSAAGVQEPQGSFFGSQEVTGSFSLLLSDETEFNRWRGASKQNLVAITNTPWKLTSSQNIWMAASLPNTYFENVSTSDDDGAFMYSADFRMIDHSQGVVRVTLRDQIPPSAYGGSVALN